MHNHQIIKLTESTFQKYIKPRLRPGYAKTLKQYQGYHPEQTHVSLFKQGGRWRVFNVGTQRMNEVLVEFAMKRSGDDLPTFICTLSRLRSVRGTYTVNAKDYGTAEKLARHLHAQITGDDSPLLRCRVLKGEQKDYRVTPIQKG